MNNQPQNAAVAELESELTNLIPVESTRQQLEDEVEKARAKKLREVSGELKPLDKKEHSLKRRAIEIVKANRNTKGFFAQGKKSIVTRAGTAGIKKGPRHIKLKKGVSEENLLDAIKQYNSEQLAEFQIDAIQVIQRVHRTKLRQTIAARPELKKIFDPYFKIVQREHVYVKTKSAKRSRPTSAKKRLRKAKVVS